MLFLLGNTQTKGAPSAGIIPGSKYAKMFVAKYTAAATASPKTWPKRQHFLKEFILVAQEMKV